MTVRREVLNLAWPIVAANILQRGVGFVDVALVGHLGTAELAGVGVANILIFIAMAFLYALGVGATVTVAYHTGAKEPEAGRQVANSSVLTGIILGLLFALAGYLAMAPAARWIGAEGPALAACIEYLQIIWCFFVFKGLVHIGASIFQGSGDTKTPLWVIGGINIVHIAIAYPLVFGKWGAPQLGVTGSAIASGISELLGAAVLLRWAHWRQLISRKIAWFKREDLRRLIRIGLPVAGERLTMQVSRAVYSHMIIGFAVAAFAAHQIGIYIEAVAFLPGLGFMQAATALMGQNLGRGDRERARRTSNESNRMALIFMTLLGVSYWFFPHFWVSLFSSDPEVIRYGEVFCKIAAFVQPQLAIALVYAGSLRGAGETKWVFYITLAGTWLMRVGFAYVAGIMLDGGLFWVWMAMPLDWLFRATLIYTRFRLSPLTPDRIS